jgi:hypothetical protein
MRNEPQRPPRPRRAGSRPSVARGKTSCTYRDVRQPPPAGPLDIVDALNLLDRCVRERGEGYRSLPDRLSAGPDDASPAATDGIVTLALSKAGAPRTALSPLAHTPVADVYASGRSPLDLTLGAVVVFRAAESLERRGQTWAASLQAAVRAASRFLELIPDGVVGDADAAAAGSHRGAPPAQAGEGGSAGRGGGP